ncbi:MAG: hypothetical protein IJ268_01735, partial [Proteobacteria bacterium]|nr:hypothetical protein [Pseudomonadota bacterium]
VFQAVAHSVTPEQDIQLIWSDAGAEADSCKMVRGLAKHFDLPDSVSCSTWRFHCETCSAMIYYVGLNAVWFEPQGARKTYFAALNQLQGKKKVSYSKYMSPDKSTNLFVRLNGRPIAFVTRNGKTTIE